jgi:hypothetical protein
MRHHEPKRHFSVALIVGGFLSIMLYVAGYFCTCHEETNGWWKPNGEAGRQRLRAFNHKWMCVAYSPLARVEAAVLGIEVVLGFQDPRGAPGDYTGHAMALPDGTIAYP